MLADTLYLDLILKRLRVCLTYTPKFGQEGQAGLALAAFEQLYASDFLYRSFGLNTPLVYTAHKAAGGLTSLYRQIGLACEELVRLIFQTQLGLDAQQSQWSYQVHGGTKPRTLQLDARILFDDIRDVAQQHAIRAWLGQAAQSLGIEPVVASALRGIVFEIRQGYKSKDSKRQNADLANAVTAYTQGYLPVILLLSAQMDADLIARYQQERWLILSGTTEDSPLRSSYAFMQQVIGYDLMGFFTRQASTLQAEVHAILTTLLTADA